jgi:predicted methyltransferase
MALSLLVLSSVALACACGPTPHEAAGPQKHDEDHAHAHHGHAGHAQAGHAHAGHGHAAGGEGHGPLVHRFDDAAAWAKEFDDPARDAWQKPAEVVALLQLTAGMKVADIGAGTGYFEPHLARAVGPGGRVLALDVEDSMVRYMEARMAREGLSNVAVAKVPFDDPKLSAGSVDRILIVDTWHHIAGREAYSAKMREALAPGGFVAVVDFTLEAKYGPPREHRLAPEQVKKELEAGGFKAEIAAETLPEQYVVIGRKAAP